MLFIDVKYAGYLSPHLKNFKQKSSYLWNYSCPTCGDISGGKQKSRGYIYRNKDSLLIKCHHCGQGTTLGNFLKQINQHLFDEYLVEKYKSAPDGLTFKEVDEYVSVTKSTIILEDSILDGLDRLDRLRETHPAVKYLIDRKIPREFWYLLYYTPKFKKFANSVKYTFKNEVGEHARMIIPFFNAAGKVYALQGRSYDDSLQRYFTIKLDNTPEKIYGLDRVDYSKRVLVVEGGIDSLFLPNSIAVSGASFDTLTIKAIKTNSTLIIDNEPRNKEIVYQLGQYIKNEYSVCMMPDTMVGKDINQYILNGYSQQQIVDIINTNTFKGLEAELVYSKWRKV